LENADLVSMFRIADSRPQFAAGIGDNGIDLAQGGGSTTPVFE
jgi:hypothetical protein